MSDVELTYPERNAVAAILIAVKAGADFGPERGRGRKATDALIEGRSDTRFLKDALAKLGIKPDLQNVDQLLNLDVLSSLDLSQKPAPLSDLESSRQILSGRP